ncbi:MAG: hypothetical protein LBI55_03855 [Oscillospiraceae bacterium]|jgi:hypothetical protein|nr:hypothetical protein [Oscillospiraceae bacterium]
MNRTLKKGLTIGALLALGISSINFSNNFDEVGVSALNNNGEGTLRKIRTTKYGNIIYRLEIFPQTAWES